MAIILSCFEPRTCQTFPEKETFPSHDGGSLPLSCMHVLLSLRCEALYLWWLRILHSGGYVSHHYLSFGEQNSGEIWLHHILGTKVLL